MPFMTAGEVQALAMGYGPRERVVTKKRGLYRPPSPYLTMGERPRTAKPRKFAMMSDAQGVGSFFSDVLTATGLRDPINHYEPGLSLAQVWAKYKGAPETYAPRVARVQGAQARKDLGDKLGTITRLRNETAPFFATGATPGDRGRALLAQLVQAVRDFRNMLDAAEKKFGVGAPAVSIPTGTPKTTADDTQKSGGGIPWGPLALAAWAIFR